VRINFCSITEIVSMIYQDDSIFDVINLNITVNSS